jgi:tRNA-2-methylthio-N6-dimethylallyladenosine synthase
MTIKRKEIPSGEITAQLGICAEIRALVGETRLAYVDTYGCQQNEADSENIRGYLLACGYEMTESEDNADIVVLNTCAIREHAEQRVFGNIGALTHAKRRRPDMLIAVCGCMATEEHVTEKLKQSYPIVDLIFGPNDLWRFPSLLLETMKGRRRVVSVDKGDGAVAEGLPHHRTDGVRAWLSVMYGCNNFCSYCVVPYTRFRERSRLPEHIIAEARELVAAGFKELTLLGQNVNSYGNDLVGGIGFPRLIREINAIEGDFVIRFMTSHPKDATDELFAAMAECEKCEKHLHLPLQSGSDRILSLMNRRYTAQKYLEQVRAVRAYMPGIVLTTDIIVGFPGESGEDFEDTLSLVKTVGFDAMFTFIYSKRAGTPAAEMDDTYTRAQKQERFDRLLELQNGISEARHKSYIGSIQRVLLDGHDRSEGLLTGRTLGGRLVRAAGSDALIGSFVNVRITGSNTWALTGEIVE